MQRRRPRANGRGRCRRCDVLEAMLDRELRGSGRNRKVILPCQAVGHERAVGSERLGEGGLSKLSGLVLEGGKQQADGFGSRPRNNEYLGTWVGKVARHPQVCMIGASIVPSNMHASTHAPRRHHHFLLQSEDGQ